MFHSDRKSLEDIGLGRGQSPVNRGDGMWIAGMLPFSLADYSVSTSPFRTNLSSRGKGLTKVSHFATSKLGGAII